MQRADRLASPVHMLHVKVLRLRATPARHYHSRISGITRPGHCSSDHKGQAVHRMSAASGTSTLFSGLTSGLDRRGPIPVRTPQQADRVMKRSDEGYLTHALSLDNTRLIVLHELRPLVATCGCTGKVYDAKSLVRLSPGRIRTAFGVDDLSALQPLILGCSGRAIGIDSSAPLAASDAGATATGSVVIGAVDVTRLFKRPEDALEKLRSVLPQSCCVSSGTGDGQGTAAGLYCPAGGVPTKPLADHATTTGQNTSGSSSDTTAEAASAGITYCFPEGRDLLFGSSVPGKLHRRIDRSIPGLLGAGPGSTPSEDATAIDLPLAALQPHQLAWPLPFEDVSLCGTARAVYTWHAKTRYCGSCGKETIAVDGGVKRVCSGTRPITQADGTITPPTCRESMYPRTDPVGITLVQSPDGQHCLLGRQKAFPPGFYSCLAGYVEAGESIEEGAAREVWEESGVRISSIAYYSSQPWPLARGAFGQVMLGFVGTAAADGDGAVNVVAAGITCTSGPQVDGSKAPMPLPTITIDRDELEDCRWFSRAEVQACMDAWYADRQVRSIGRVADNPADGAAAAQARPNLGMVWAGPPTGSAAAGSNTPTAATAPGAAQAESAAAGVATTGPVPAATATVKPTDAANISSGGPGRVPGALKIPGPYAIAHQLIKAWLDGKGQGLL